MRFDRGSWEDLGLSSRLQQNDCGQYTESSPLTESVLDLKRKVSFDSPLTLAALEAGRAYLSCTGIFIRTLLI